ncbi:MAG TPA: esterase-like activity of phytase family protein, partial [Xanthobacteraceae bacterium]|nr:esterase-like activity of phytase family protein [Xanthobacteraceae bacterium]
MLARRAALLLALLLPLHALAEPAGREPAPPAKIEITARSVAAFEPRDPQRVRFGPLTFRGGLSLTSSHPEFGGISAIRVQADGANFIAVSDKGRWIRGRIVYDGTRPAGIADAEIAPVLGPDGRTLSARGWYDTESIAQDGGTVWLGIERVNRIVRFDIGKHGLLARGQPIVVPPGIQRLPNNKGLECLDVVPRKLPLGGSLIAISERGLDTDGNIQGFLIGGPSP